MKEYLIVYNVFNLNFSAFHNAHITASNKKEALEKLKRKINNAIIINIISLTEDNDITE
jgi:hypothetical protein